MKFKGILAAFLFLTTASVLFGAHTAEAHELSNDKLTIQTGEHGEISSIRIKGDAFPTEYVMNASVTPEQNTADHQWLGELMFTYRLDEGSWTKAWTNKSADARKITTSGNRVTVTYENSNNAEGIRNFKVIETYSAESNGSVLWNIQVPMSRARIVNHPILGPKPERRQVSFMFDGRPMQGLAGEPLAAALLASGVRLLRRHEESGTARGVYCAIGHCNECRLTVHPFGTVRSCLTKLEEGMVVETGRQLSNEITGRIVT